MVDRYEQRERVFSLRDKVLECLDRGMSIKKMAAQLGLDDMPSASLYRNVAALQSQRDTRTGTASNVSEGQSIPLRGEPVLEEESAPQPDAGGTPAEAEKKPRRKKRKFVSATVGGDNHDDLNPAKWREERLAKKSQKDA